MELVLGKIKKAGAPIRIDAHRLLAIPFVECVHWLYPPVLELSPAPAGQNSVGGFANALPFPVGTALTAFHLRCPHGNLNKDYLLHRGRGRIIYRGRSSHRQRSSNNQAGRTGNQGGDPPTVVMSMMAAMMPSTGFAGLANRPPQPRYQ